MEDNRQMRNAGESGPPEGTGYSSPGDDTILQSSSRAVPSPSSTTEERLTVPDSQLESIGERPADANPALAETVGAEQGTLTTAEMLRARETAEETGLRQAGAHIYEDQPPGVDTSAVTRTVQEKPTTAYRDTDKVPVERLESPSVQEDFMAATGGVGGLNLRGRADATVDRVSAEGTAQAAQRGEGPVGSVAQKMDYEGPEQSSTTAPTDYDRIPPMSNIPSEDENG